MGPPVFSRTRPHHGRSKNCLILLIFLFFPLSVDREAPQALAVAACVGNPASRELPSGPMTAGEPSTLQYFTPTRNTAPCSAHSPFPGPTRAQQVLQPCERPEKFPPPPNVGVMPGVMPRGSPSGPAGVTNKEAASPNPTVPVPACQQVIGSGHTGRDGVAVGPASRPAQTGEQGTKNSAETGASAEMVVPLLDDEKRPKPVSRCPAGWSRSSPG